MNNIAILCPSAFDYILNKTGNMLIRYKPESVSCIIDSDKAGLKAQDVLSYGGNIPVVTNFDEAQQFEPNTIVIGSAPQGGFITEVYRKELRSAIKYGCDIYSGMHQFLNDDEELSLLANEKGTKIYDLRRPPNPPHFSKGSWKDRKTKVLLIVGTDCDTGKMTTAWEISERLRKKGKNIEFIGTGQTGILLSGHGIPVDAVIGDFMAGEIEHAIDQINEDKDLIIVEGQGSLTNMYYAGVTLGLLHGSMPDYMVMTDEPKRKLDVTGYKMASISSVMDLHISLMNNFKQSKFLGINLLTLHMNEDDALKTIQDVEKKFQIPATDLIRFGNRKLIDNIIEEIS